MREPLTVSAYLKQRLFPLFATVSRWPSVFVAPHFKGWTIGIALLSLLTTVAVWHSYDKTFSGNTLRILWLAEKQPDEIFLWLVHPFVRLGTESIVFLLAIIHAAIAVLFVRIGERINIGRKTLFLLFILLNFSPEYNDSRLELNVFLFQSLWWLIAVWWFLRWHEKNLIIGFIGWSLLTWFSVFFDLSAIIWAIGFPLCFLCWPGRYRHWWQGIGERGKTLAVYYAIIFLLIVSVPYWREYLILLVKDAIPQIKNVAQDMSLFVNAEEGLTVDPISAFLIANILVALNAFKIAGVLFIFILWLSVRVKIASVLQGRVRLFFAYCLIFSCIVSACSLLVEGHLKNDLSYIPVLLLFLWLGANGAFYVVQRITHGKIKSERLLIIVWLMVAYALASLIQFGPSAIYQREAGQWVASHIHGGRIFSNSTIALYYAKQSPLNNNPHNIDFEDLPLLVEHFSPQDTFIYSRNRRHNLPAHFEADYRILAQFSNRHGDMAYVIQAKYRE